MSFAEAWGKGEAVKQVTASLRFIRFTEQARQMEVSARGTIRCKEEHTLPSFHRFGGKAGRFGGFGQCLLRHAQKGIQG